MIRKFLLGTAFGFAASSGAMAAAFSYSTDFSAGVGSEWAINTSYNNNDAGILGQLQDGAAVLSLNGQGGGTSSLSFDLLGFRTVDGVNCCTDTFRLFINGAEVLNGHFAMGGGGAEFLNTNTLGATVTSNGTFIRNISINSFAVQAGTNLVRFDYGQMQGFGDEAWGLDNVRLAGEVRTVSAIPEPETYAMMLAGLGLLGFSARRRKQKTEVAAA